MRAGSSRFPLLPMLFACSASSQGVTADLCAGAGRKRDLGAGRGRRRLDRSPPDFTALHLTSRRLTRSATGVWVTANDTNGAALAAPLNPVDPSLTEQARERLLGVLSGRDRACQLDDHPRPCEPGGHRAPPRRHRAVRTRDCPLAAGAPPTVAWPRSSAASRRSAPYRAIRRGARVRRRPPRRPSPPPSRARSASRASRSSARVDASCGPHRLEFRAHGIRLLACSLCGLGLLVGAHRLLAGGRLRGSRRRRPKRGGQREAFAVRELQQKPRDRVRPAAATPGMCSGADPPGRAATAAAQAHAAPRRHRSAPRPSPARRASAHARPDAEAS